MTVHVKYMKKARGKKMEEEAIRLPTHFDLDEWEAIDPPTDVTRESLVGRYVLVYWPKFKKYYPGRIVGLHGKKHLVTYFERSKDTPKEEDETYAEKLLGYKHVSKWKLLRKKRT